MSGPTASLLAAAALLGLGAAAHAQASKETVGTLQVRARLEASCGVTLGDLDFGEYHDPSGSKAKGSIDVRCTPGVRYTIALDGGGAGDVDHRRMTGAGELAYQLYIDASTKRVFGDATGGETVSVDANGRWQKTTVYGEVPKRQGPVSGGYQDIVTMTLTY